MWNGRELQAAWETSLSLYLGRVRHESACAHAPTVVSPTTEIGVLTRYASHPAR